MRCRQEMAVMRLIAIHSIHGADQCSMCVYKTKVLAVRKAILTKEENVAQTRTENMSLMTRVKINAKLVPDLEYCIKKPKALGPSLM